ncbi:hypothetical protein NPIL_371781 [Nephila pilipes]|uniref:Autophagy-related protein n=1 Tax=Nephila pilipes TaxID=299642 RepID=A0A8X6N9N0_NEPPI|nr:hypothetical protein NPIL_371781 [Nephila pilipes]
MDHSINESSESRRREETRIALINHHGRIPVIMKPIGSTLPALTPCRYLLPVDMTIANLRNIIKKKLNIKSHEAFFVMVKGMMPLPSLSIIQIYDDYKSPDGYLYLTYALQEFFGGTGMI